MAEKDAQKKNAKYFCESCGSEVAANAKFCPKCGRFFSAVRCPECGKTGSVNDFLKGCPRCHYAMTHEDIYGVPEEEENQPKRKKARLSKKSKLQIKKAFSKHEIQPIQSELPVAFYLIGLILLIGAFILVMMRCVN